MSSAPNFDFSKTFFHHVGTWAHHEAGMFIPQVCCADEFTARQAGPGSLLRLVGGGWGYVPLSLGVQKRSGELVITIKSAEGSAGRFVKASALAESATHILPGILSQHIDARAGEKQGANAASIFLTKSDQPVRFAVSTSQAGSLILEKAVDGGTPIQADSLEQLLAPGELNVDFVPIKSAEIVPPIPDLTDSADRTYDIELWVTDAAMDIQRQRIYGRCETQEEAEALIANPDSNELIEIERAVRERIVAAFQGLRLILPYPEQNTLGWLGLTAALVAGALPWSGIATAAMADRAALVLPRIIALFLDLYEHIADADAVDGDHAVHWRE